VYIYLHEAMQIERTRNLDGSRLIDYTEDGEPVEIELLDVIEGISLDGLPARGMTAELLADHYIEVCD